MRILFFALLLLSSLCFGQTITRVPAKSVQNPIGFVEYIPKDTSKAVIVWLHGLGGNSGWGSDTDLKKLEGNAIMGWLRSHNVPFTVLAPQSYNGYWPHVRLAPFIKWVSENYDGDIHLAGLSSGGYGCTEMIKNNSDESKLITSYTVMSSSLQEGNNFASTIVANNQYVWIHHGAKDKAPNALSAVSNFHEALNSLDGKRSRLTVYTDLGHSAWDEVYDASGTTRNQYTGGNYYEWRTGTWYNWLASISDKVQPEPIPVKDKIVDMFWLGKELHAISESGRDDVIMFEAAGNLYIMQGEPGVFKVISGESEEAKSLLKK